MVIGIVIPHETTVPIQQVEFHSLTDYQSAVGGYIETVTIDGHSLVIVADQDGKMKQLPINRRATCIWWLFNPEGLGGDFLVGDVLILSAPGGTRTQITLFLMPQISPKNPGKSRNLGST